MNLNFLKSLVRKYMDKIIPCFYADYGRYVTRFRAFPFNIDCLKLVERRLLMSLYYVAKGPKFVKAAKVVGNCIAELHPHGDISTYGTLQQLVNRGFAKGEGNWGSKGLEDDSAAAMRYVECKLEKWVVDFAFKYIDYVDFNNFEYGEEPISLPCPLPIGLVGSGITTGIAFHRTLIPRYKLKDLARRLSWLLENNIINNQNGAVQKLTI